MTREMVFANRFQGKRVIVTGAGAGIGKATAIRFAAEGARVGLVDRRRDALDAVADAISSKGGISLVLLADCSVEEEIASAVDTAAAEWGGMDVVVANAGIELLGRDDRVDRLERRIWDQLISTNLTGQFLTCKHGARQLLAAGGGAIVCLGSNCAQFGMAANEPAYSASKGGIYAMMKVMAIDYARHNIRVNMVVPGFIDTPMNAPVMRNEKELAYWSNQIPVGRAGTSAECASAILWLASDEASYCVGTALVVDGGQSSV
jgi:NAD(P)-dependent dehydrogenase (short-subunit alcohol dehydrogenase family)